MRLIRKRNSRWTRDPVFERGTPLSACITERDIEVFKLLARYRYLPCDDIHAFVGGSFANLTRRLDLLQRKPNCYLNRPHQQRQSATANYRRLVYELDERGSRILHDRGLPVLPRGYHRNFSHELLVCRIMASIEIGIRADRSLRLISWPEIQASPSTPQSTRNAPRPERIPVSFRLHGEACQIEVAADGFPFGIQRNINGKPTYLFFPGIEADCGTEPVDTNAVDRSSIYRKFAAYIAITEQSIHRSHFGFPNLFVPIITTTPARMQSMKRLLEKVTDSRGSKMFLFKLFPAFTSFERPPGPGGHMLTEPWQRVGFEPLNLTS
jgi:hypothetical protein